MASSQMGLPLEDVCRSIIAHGGDVQVLCRSRWTLWLHMLWCGKSCRADAAPKQLIARGEVSLAASAALRYLALLSHHSDCPHHRVRHRLHAGRHSGGVRAAGTRRAGARVRGTRRSAGGGASTAAHVAGTSSHVVCVTTARQDGCQSNTVNINVQRPGNTYILTYTA